MLIRCFSDPNPLIGVKYTWESDLLAKLCWLLVGLFKKEEDRSVALYETDLEYTLFNLDDRRIVFEGINSIILFALIMFVHSLL